MKSRDSLALSAAIGALAGLRALTPPAVVSQAARYNLIGLRRSYLRRLRSAGTANVLAALALGELIGDKLPFTPSRLGLGPLAARAVSGALCGSVIGTGKIGRPFRNKSSDRNVSSMATGAALGALGAIGGAFAGFYLRRELNMRFAVPDPAIAFVEDLAAIAGSAVIVSKKVSLLSLATAGIL
ncbi:MAG TPA: DUF4126 family protein [Terriglobales bacterium]|nr:DUF4126 family protein [Terriglobales bacterium]